MGASQSTRKITLINDDKAGVIKLSESLAHRLRGQIEGQHAAATSAVEKGSQETQEPLQDVAATPSEPSLPSVSTPTVPSYVAPPEPTLPPQVPLETPVISKPSIPTVAPDLPADGESPVKSQEIPTPPVASASPGLTDSVTAPLQDSESPHKEVAPEGNLPTAQEPSLVASPLPPLSDSKTEVEPVVQAPVVESKAPQGEPITKAPLQESEAPEVETVAKTSLEESKTPEVEPVAEATVKEGESPLKVVLEPAPLENNLPKEEVLPSVGTIPEDAASIPSKAEFEVEVPLGSQEPMKEEKPVSLELAESKITHDQSGPTDLPNSPVVKIEDESASKNVVEAAVDAAVGAVTVLVGKLPKEDLLKAAFGEEGTESAKASVPEEPPPAAKPQLEEPSPAATTTATIEVSPPPPPPIEPVKAQEIAPEQTILVLPPEIEVVSAEVTTPAVVETPTVPSEDVAPAAVSVPAIAESIAEAMVQGSADVPLQTPIPEPSTVAEPLPAASTPDVGIAIQAVPQPTLTQPSGSIPPWSIYAEEAHLLVMRLREEKEQELQAAEKMWREKLDKREEEFTNIGKLTQEQLNASLKEVESMFLKATCSPVCQNQQEEVMKCYQDHPKQSLRCSGEVAQFTQCVDLTRLQAVMKQHSS